MTTTAFDCDNGVIACDSRWTIKSEYIERLLGEGKHVLHVDDTGFNKVIVRHGGALICAGDGGVIANMKHWWSQPTIDVNAIPEIGGDSSIMIVSQQGKRVFDVGAKQVVYNLETNHMHAIFSGSGGSPAASVFMHCSCVKASVSGAMIFDPYTGGEVKFHDLGTGKNNLHDETMDYNCIMDATRKRGMIMSYTGMYAANSDNLTITPLSEHPEADKIREALSNGSAKAYAPTGAPAIDWTPERINKLKDAAREIMDLEKELQL